MSLKGIFLFLLTNIAVIAVASISLSLLGVGGYVNQYGLDLGNLLAFAAVFGFAGSFVSLFLSKWMALQMTGAEVIDPQHPRNQAEAWLVQTVHRLADKAGIGHPDVAIYPDPAPNAFATGWNRNNALVAVSTGLLENMTQDEIEAVLAHEVAHIANGDMITMALLQGVVNTFVIFFARIVGYFVDKMIFRNEDDAPGIGFYITSFIFEILFGILASTIVMWYSRKREFRADAGGAYLAGRDKMIAALKRLMTIHEPAHLPEQLAAFGINESVGERIMGLFASHPPLEKRIEYLMHADERQLKLGLGLS